MGLQNLIPVENPQHYLDIAFKHAEKTATSIKIKGRKIDKKRKIEIKRITAVKKSLITNMDKIVKNFPTIDNLSIFYQELIDITIGKVELKKSIATLTWIAHKTDELSYHYINLIENSGNIHRIKKLRKEYYGRISSLLKKSRNEFKFLKEARKKIRKFPILKDIHTICISGYPNVGKSTLLNKLTRANPEINIYPFTTKSLMVGYIGKKCQIIDTPGTFGKGIKRMNYIEKQSFLALKHVANEIIFVIDISESCGYTLTDQEKLFEYINETFKKPKIIFISKTDLADETKINDEIRKLKNKYKIKVITNWKLLKKAIKNH